MRVFSLLLVGVALADESCSDGTCAQDEATLLQMKGLRQRMLETVKADENGVENLGTQCWHGNQCNGQGGECPSGYCGDGGVCCRADWTPVNDQEREECGDNGYGIVGMHTCQPRLLNEGQQCWHDSQCDQQAGRCPDFCGARGVCCRANWQAQNDQEREDCGQNGHGNNGMHQCHLPPDYAAPEPVSAPEGVDNWNTQCWHGNQCNGQGGECPSGYCGEGGVCCRAGWTPVNDQEREECGDNGYGINGMHTCQPRLLNEGQQCWHDDQCDQQGGRCQNFCGARGVCCRKNWAAQNDKEREECGENGHGNVGMHQCHLPPLQCPDGWDQKGDIGADIGGCGLQNCDERYDLTSEVECAARCDATWTCQGFSWAPMDGDRNHPGVAACTLYNSDVPTGSWTGVDGTASQILCGRSFFARLGSEALGTVTCPAGQESISQEQCWEAGQRLIPTGGSSAVQELRLGTWNHVPTGCFMRHGNFNVLFSSNPNPNGNTDDWVPICSNP